MTDWRTMRKAMLAAATAAVLSLPTSAHAQPAPEPAPASTAGPAAGNSAEAAARDLATQGATLRGPASTQQQRDDAAARLVSRQSPEADEILLRVLGEAVNVQGQQAVAKALASDPSPDPRFIDALARTLGGNRETNEWAAQALANYKNNSEVRERLQSFARNGTFENRQRSAAVRAMGRLVDKATVQFLIDTLNNPQESVVVQQAAADALTQITDLDYSLDRQRWQAWWAENQNRPEFQWVMDRLERNSTQKNVLEQRFDSFRAFAERMFRESYRNAGEEEKPRLVLSTLKAESEDARLMAVNLVFEEVGLTGSAGIYQRVADALRGMVGDSSPKVRERVAQTLGSAGAGDAEVVGAILAQLPQETNKDVLKAMLFALGNSEDARTVDPLLQRLNDSSYAVAEVAADALAKKADRLGLPENEALARAVADRLSQRLADIRPNDQAASRLRQNIVMAMAELGHPSLYRDLVRLTSDNEKLPVRGRAYQGLGKIGNPAAADHVVRGLADNDPGVRSRAIEALQAIGTFNNVPALYDYLLRETNENNREDAWKALVTLFRKAENPQALSVWAERFNPRNASELDLTRRAAVLKIMEERYAAAAEAAPQSQRELSLVRMNLGQTMLELARLDKNVETQRPKAELAAQQLADALDYLNKTNAPENAVLPVMQARLEALLIARKHADAMAFANEGMQARRGFTQDVGTTIMTELKRLERGREVDAALALIDEARKLPIDLSARLDGLKQRFQQLRNSGGQMWFSPYFASRNRLGATLLPPWA